MPRFYSEVKSENSEYSHILLVSYQLHRTPLLLPLILGLL